MAAGWFDCRGGSFFYGLSWRCPRVLVGGDARPHIVHHLTLLVVLGSALLAGRETGIGAMLRHAAIWRAVGALAVLGYSYRANFRNLGNRNVSGFRPDTALTTGQGDLAIRRSSDGHFSLTTTVEGVRIRFLMDTGARLITLVRRMRRPLASILTNCVAVSVSKPPTALPGQPVYRSVKYPSKLSAQEMSAPRSAAPADRNHCSASLSSIVFPATKSVETQ